MLRVEKLPKIENHVRLMQELEDCKRLSEEVKTECSEINIIVNKLYQERQYWSRYLSLMHFTASINVYARIEMMKNWL